MGLILLYFVPMPDYICPTTFYIFYSMFEMEVR